MRSSESILEARRVYKTFGGVVAVNVDHLQVERGRITSLIGPNGAGKTTFFDIVTGFTAAKGDIRFDGTPIGGRPTHAIARQGLVRTFQLTRALGRMSVLENMLLASPDQPAERLVGLVRSVGRVNRTEALVRERAEELLERFNLTHLTDEYAGRLSGGQKKLLELARALMNRPRMVLLDEPMAGVNPALGEQLLRYVQELRDEGMTFLLVEHDMDVIMRVSERVIVMSDGAIIADGAPDEVRTDPAVVTAYLGEHGAEVVASAHRDEEEE